MMNSASAGFGGRGDGARRRCGMGSMKSWSAWEIGAMVAGFVVFWPLGLLALFLKWKNGELWRGSSAGGAPWNGFRRPDFTAWTSPASSRGFPGAGFGGSGNAAFDAYRQEQLKRLDEERRKLEEEQKAFRDFVDRLRRAKDQDEFDRFMAERSRPASTTNDPAG